MHRCCILQYLDEPVEPCDVSDVSDVLVDVFWEPADVSDVSNELVDVFGELVDVFDEYGKRLHAYLLLCMKLKMVVEFVTY